MLVCDGGYQGDFENKPILIIIRKNTAVSKAIFDYLLMNAKQMKLNNGKEEGGGWGKWKNIHRNGW